MYVSPTQDFTFQAKFSVSAPYKCVFQPSSPTPQPTAHSYPLSPPPSATATISYVLPRSSRSYQVNHRATSLPRTICVHGFCETPSFIHIPTPTPKHRRLSLSIYRRELEEVDVHTDSHLAATLAGSAQQTAGHSFLVPPDEHLTAVAAEWGAYFARLECIN